MVGENGDDVDDGEHDEDHDGQETRTRRGNPQTAVWESLSPVVYK